MKCAIYAKGKMHISLLVLVLTPPVGLLVFVAGGVLEAAWLKIAAFLLIVSGWIVGFKYSRAAHKLDSRNVPTMPYLILSAIISETIVTIISFYVFPGISKDVGVLSARGAFAIVIECVVIFLFIYTSINCHMLARLSSR